MSRRRETEWDWDRRRLTLNDALLLAAVLIVIGACVIVPATAVIR